MFISSPEGQIDEPKNSPDTRCHLCALDGPSIALSDTPGVAGKNAPVPFATNPTNVWSISDTGADMAAVADVGIAATLADPYVRGKVKDGKHCYSRVIYLWDLQRDRIVGTTIVRVLWRAGRRPPHHHDLPVRHPLQRPIRCSSDESSG